MQFLVHPHGRFRNKFGQRFDIYGDIEPYHRNDFGAFIRYLWNEYDIEVVEREDEMLYEGQYHGKHLIRIISDRTF